MSPRGERQRLIFLELRNHERRKGDGIDADVPATAVRRPAVHHELEPGEPAMRGTNGEARRFGDERRAGGDTRTKQPRHAFAAVLLIGHGREDDLTREAAFCGTGGGGCERGEARLHVGGPATVDPSIALLGVPRRMNHPLDADGVEVSVEEDWRQCGCCSPDARDDIRTRSVIDRINAEAPAFENVRECECNVTFARRTRRHRRVARIDGDERPRQRNGVTARYGARTLLLARWLLLRGGLLRRSRLLYRFLCRFLARWLA